MNNDNNVQYRDEGPDTGISLPGEGLHLPVIGTKCLLTNLGLAEMANSYLSKGPRRWPSSKPATGYHEAKYTTRIANTYTSMAPPTVKM